MARHLEQYPSHPTPADATLLAPLDIARFDGLHPMVGETTTVPGLVITPEIAGQPARFSGRWRVTHQPSGMSVSPAAALVYAREAVTWLTAAGIDWDRPKDDIGTDPAAAEVYARLHWATRDAQEEHRPLLYARTSWVDWPPLWRVCRGGRISEPGFFTYDGAADFADTACDPTHLAHGVAAELLHPDAVIHRDIHSPGWALRCASGACQDREMWLLRIWEDGAPIPLIESRAELGTVAAADGWRQHDRQHWTCPACTRLYR